MAYACRFLGGRGRRKATQRNERTRNRKEDVTFFSMYRAIALAMLVAGVALLIFGINALLSLGSDIGRFFTGSPTDKALWMLIAWSVLCVVGLAGVVRGPKAA